MGNEVQEPEHCGHARHRSANSCSPARSTGEFIAVNSDTGKIVWQFQTPSGIVSQPVTWDKDGKQYVTVGSGSGGVYVARAGDPNLVNVPPGGTLWTFKLMDN